MHRLVAALMLLAFGSTTVHASPELWRSEWPTTDFSKTSVDYSEIISGGPPKDGIPAIDRPIFRAVAEIDDLSATEPVISLRYGGQARAYPLRILLWHEIVNDEIAGVPLVITYCPLCDSAVVFDRRVDGRVLDFGTTGKLRFSDLVMYDRQTESWWQQFMGEAIVGTLTGARLKMVPARVESFARFAERYPDGQVLVPNNPFMRRYGLNPYRGYDTASRPFLYRGPLPAGIAPMARVVAVGEQAWPLQTLRERGRIESGGLILTWNAGQNSALDDVIVPDGRDIGNVVVQRRTADGRLEDVIHDTVFAFAFAAFNPDGVIHETSGSIRSSN